jgi:hypothetical protein
VYALEARKICDFDTHIFVIYAQSKRLKARSLAQTEKTAAPHFVLQGIALAQ